jgi:hypothetical protein
MIKLLALALLLLAAAPARASRSLAQADANATTAAAPPAAPNATAPANASSASSAAPTNGTLDEEPLVNPFTGRTLVPFLPANSDAAGGLQEQPPRTPASLAPINQVRGCWGPAAAALLRCLQPGAAGPGPRRVSHPASTRGPAAPRPHAPPRSSAPRRRWSPP